jgi:hypothetical protein
MPTKNNGGKKYLIISARHLGECQLKITRPVTLLLAIGDWASANFHPC